MHFITILSLTIAGILGFWSFQGKVFVLSLPNLVWVFIGLIAGKGLLLMKILLCTSFVSGHF